jgi:hypothetical protein
MPSKKTALAQPVAPRKREHLHVARAGASRVRRLALADDEDEAALWQDSAAFAASAVDLWATFLDLRDSDNNKLASDQKARFVSQLRAISWVESRHGTGSGIQPAHDPCQCGNPSDAWWKELVDPNNPGDRFVGGPDAHNYWANELPAQAELFSDEFASAKLSTLQDRKVGHDDPNFNKWMSLFWAVPHLIWTTNVPNGGKAYLCRALDRGAIVAGAVAYNGGGDLDYGSKIDSALTLGGWGPASLTSRTRLDAGSLDTMAALLEATVRRVSESAAFHSSQHMDELGTVHVRARARLDGIGEVEAEIVRGRSKTSER